MPRRDALSEKKKERLMQEHEQLQKLMLQARSSVRRSSLKDQSGIEDQETYIEAETAEEEPLNLEEQYEGETATSQEVERSTPTDTESGSDSELFQTPITAREQPVAKRPLTEYELFPETNHSEKIQQNTSTIRVILPEQNTSVKIAQPDRRDELEVNSFSPHSESRVAPEAHQEVPEVVVPVDAYEPQENRSGTKTRAYILLLVAALLAGFGGYYLYQAHTKSKPVVAKENTKPAATSPPETNSGAPANAGTGQNTTAEKSSNAAPVNTADTQKASGDKPISDELEGFDNVTVVEKTATPKTQHVQTGNEKAPKTTSSSEVGKYKVISKAYFYNKPDERTRRKAFIIHWNNAVLSPLEEKNGFVYIVFTNHLGQTSKGWLRKNDLKRID